MAMVPGALYGGLRQAGTTQAPVDGPAEDTLDIRTEFGRLNNRIDVIEAKLETLKWAFGFNMALTILFGGCTIAALWKIVSH